MIAHEHVIHDGRLRTRSGAVRADHLVCRVGLGPHRLNRHLRSGWFFDKTRFGGILNDIGSHQIDQFLYFTGSTEAMSNLGPARFMIIAVVIVVILRFYPGGLDALIERLWPPKSVRRS